MKRDGWLPWTLRQELIQALDAHYEAADEGSFPPISPAGLLDDLNAVGPTLGGDCLPVVEMLLAELHGQGLIGQMPAPSPRHSPLYMSRASALEAMRWNAMVILLPLKEGARPKP